MKLFVLFLVLMMFGASKNLTAQEILPCPEGYRNLGPASNLGAADVVVLVPGAGSQGEELFLGFFKWGEYFDQLQKELLNNGQMSIVVASDKYGNEDIQARIRRVREVVLALGQQGHRVVLIGHSMGGLAARVALRDSKLWPYVAAAVTVSTPHRGTPIIDMLLDPKTPFELVRKLLAIFGYDEKHKDYLRELSEAMAPKWDKQEDHQIGMPPVYSLLVASHLWEKIHSVPPLALTSEILQRILSKRDSVPEKWREDDGFVHLQSQIWGQCLGQVYFDHGSVIGKTISLERRGNFSVFVTELVDLLRSQGQLK